MALAQHFAHDAEAGKWPSKALLVIGSYMVSLVQLGCAISCLLTFSVQYQFHFCSFSMSEYCHMFSMGGAALNTKYALWALSRAYLHDFDNLHFLPSPSILVILSF
jgi:hypothetical protein